MRLPALPRWPLAHLPTPLEDARNLSAALDGPRILIKRDDLTGLALGGNKTRKLEYLIADAWEQGATVVITTGAVQSNHCRQTAAAARIAGMRCVLVLSSADADPPVQGNLLLDYLLGAEVHFVRDRSERMPAMERIAEELHRQGERPYIIPTGGSTPLGASAYVAAAFELAQQLIANSWEVSRVYVTSSMSGGTHAGLALGARLCGNPFTVVGIGIEADAAAIRDVVLPLANATAEFLEVDVRLGLNDLHIDDRYVGAGYGVPTEECLEAIKLAAQTEGLLLDPVYTGKTLAGLIDHIRRGEIGRDETVVFIHTGGAPALFAQADALVASLQR
jgi:D-cysteine desulfhydrase family pyridoxal phosphate-dependent enzyme